MNNCPVCGSHINGNDGLCKICGTKITENKKYGSKVVVIIAIVFLVVFSMIAGFLILSVMPTSVEQNQETKVEVMESIQDSFVESVETNLTDFLAVGDSELVQNGIVEYENGNYDGAISIFIEALNRDYEDEVKFTIYFNLADSYYYKEAYEDAIINYHKALEIKYDYLTTVYLAQAYFLVDDPQNAEKYFDEAIKMDEVKPEAYVYFAEYLYYTGKLDAAEENALKALVIEQNDQYPIELLVYIYFDMGMEKKVAAYYKMLSDQEYPYIERVTDYIN